MRKLLSYFLILLGAILLLLIFFIKGFAEVELFERQIELPLKLISGVLVVVIFYLGWKVRKSKP